MLVNSDQILRKARENHYAVPSANFVDADTLTANLQAAQELGRPIIMAVAESHLGKLITLEEAAELGRYYGEKAAVPVVLHLDHGESIETAKRAVDLGFTSVMLDASMDSFDKNVEKTREVVSYAHASGVSTEAEIGHVGTGTKYESDTDNIYTTVEEAVAFAERSGVDSLAVSIGTAHGLYKGTPKINFDRLHELYDAVKIPLVLHGGSSTGDMNLHRCATEGIAKINIYSDLLLAAVKKIRALKLEEESVEAYYDFKFAAKDGATRMLKHYYEVFATEAMTI